MLMVFCVEHEKRNIFAVAANVLNFRVIHKNVYFPITNKIADNIVDYLIVGFFVISFLSSLFKKKKSKTNTPKSVRETSVRSQQRVPEQQPKAKTPFEDFFKSINEELANAKKEVSRSEVDEYYEQAMQNSDDSEIVNQDTLMIIALWGRCISFLVCGSAVPFGFFYEVNDMVEWLSQQIKHKAYSGGGCGQSRSLTFREL